MVLWYVAFAILALSTRNPNEIFTVVVFDGIMITLAMLTLNAFHPGVFLRESDHPSTSNSERLVLADDNKTGNGEMRVV